MDKPSARAIAIVGLGAILPDAMDVAVFWNNIVNKCYSVREVPADRWKIAEYFDPDPAVPDKTYSKIGAWVQGFELDWKRFRIPPKVSAAMDPGQQWAVTIAAQALSDFGYPEKHLDTDRTGVVLGVAMGGEMHYRTYQRLSFPEFSDALQRVPEFESLPHQTRAAILKNWHEAVEKGLPPVTEDSMPGELANIVSGRVANVLNLRGPNFITDAACASSLAAIQASMELLQKGDADAILAGGVDHNMGASTFIKFCKIGALSATGSRPFGEGADGFVMGEGAAVFLLKRFEDAERAGDRIYAVIRGVGASSDGRGKGITAPNPLGQQLAIRRAWENAGLDPATATLIEAHGTSTRVGDVVEVESLAALFGGAARHSIALGSVKSNIGHLKAGAGAAGLLKSTLAIYHKVLPPTLNSQRPNPEIDFDKTPFYLNYEPGSWDMKDGQPRRCGISAYGFGGTNFHVVMEEYVPGMLQQNNKVYASVSIPDHLEKDILFPVNSNYKILAPAPVRGILAIGASTPLELKDKLNDWISKVQAGFVPAVAFPSQADLSSLERIVIDFGSGEELQDRLLKAQKVLDINSRLAWNALQAQGIYRGCGNAFGKIAFLFPGQGSQYLNMGRELATISPEVAKTFETADNRLMKFLGKPLSEFIFISASDPERLQKAELDLMQTSITQPAVLTLDLAIYHLLAQYGFKPDMVMGHSLGEYAAMAAAGIMPFEDVLEAAAARGSEMAKVKVEDTGEMAAVMAPYEEVLETLKSIDGYLQPANINSTRQCVIGGESHAVEEAIRVFQEKGYQANRLLVSHAFHTRIVAPASQPLRQVLNRLHVSSPQIPLVGNVTGDFYPPDPEEIKDLLEKQIASPVQWVKGLKTLYQSGARAFVEVGPKKALKGFVDDVFGDKQDVVSLFTNHPKYGELASFNQALCGLYAAGYAMTGENREVSMEKPVEIRNTSAEQSEVEKASNKILPITGRPGQLQEPGKKDPGNGRHAIQDVEQNMVQFDQPLGYTEPGSIEMIGKILAQALQQSSSQLSPAPAAELKPYDRNESPLGSVVISGTGLGLPGTEKAVMDPDNALRILHGEQFVDLIPERFRKRMLEKRVTRLIKSEDGGGTFQPITDVNEVVRLAGRKGSFSLSKEYGISEKLVQALDITTQLAMAAGLDALREAGIPLVQTYRTTSTGKYLPDRWILSEALQDETGVIFASAFPGGDCMAGEFKRYYIWQNRLDQVAALEDLRQYTSDPETLKEIMRRIANLRDEMEREPYEFDRRFLFRVLSMGHSQFAEYIGARGPNTQVNSACASTATAISLAEDWIRTGRCRRVIVIAADDVSGENLLEWVGAGFLATGAVATDDRVEDASLPFDRRRHGMIVGMGACGLVIESEDAVRERGMRAIVEILNSETYNSAFHATRLDINHIASVMDKLVTTAERRFGFHRSFIAPQTVFMSHETYTPARGGSASAEVAALRKTFGEAAKDIIIANTKGFTGHAMGVGVEDVIAVKILEYGIVPPVPNFKEVDPDLGLLNLSRGGRYPVQYAIHLAAGFGSQISMTFTRRIPGGLDRIDYPVRYQCWLDDISGYNRAETEVIQRVLRVKSHGKPDHSPAPSSWQHGTGPSVRASGAFHGGENIERPARMHIPDHEPGNIPVSASTIFPPGVNLHESHSDSIVRSQFKSSQSVMPESAPIVEKVAIIQPDEPVMIPNIQEQVEQVTATPPELVDPVVDKVLEIVSQKTGYPKDMLEMDLDMEADLGIDTVKQAETFLAIREAFGIAQQENLKLRDYPTLSHAVQFVHKMRPDLAPAQYSIQDQSEKIHQERVTTRQEALSIDRENPPVSIDPIVDKVLDIVSQKTGYPKDMLELDLDMEADLGIDTVKQAETFLAIRETFDIPQQENLKLRDYPTLAHAVDFVRKMRPDLVNDSQADSREVESSPVPFEIANSQEEVKQEKPARPIPAPLEAASVFPRRIPWPILRPGMDLYKPTGVKLDVNSRVVVMPDQGRVGDELARQLRERQVQTLILEEDFQSDTLEERLQSWLSEGPIQGVYWLPALDVEPALEDMELEDWREHNRRRVKNLYLTMRKLYNSVQGHGSFLISATRLGGLHGYGSEGAVAPLGGAVAGFTKAYKRERLASLVKVVDFEIGVEPARVARQLVEETLSDPGVVEAGYWDGGRYGITLTDNSLSLDKECSHLGSESVFMITGAAGGITSAITADLAAASGGVFYLLDLAKNPGQEDKADIDLFRRDKEALKKKLIEAARASGERVTPAQIDQKIFDLERQEAALSAIEAVVAAGGRVEYFSLNLLDSQAVKAVMEQVRQRHGRIDVLLHAAGLEISRALPDKDPAQFDRVFSVKADGFFNLLHASKGMPVGTVLVFSSVAGRFGNNGQVDYSAANDLLCKMVSSLKNWRPGTRGIAIDWTAWEGIGMASRGSIPKIMEAAGIDMLPQESGIPAVRRELLCSSSGGEAVIGGRLGMLVEEWDETGGLDPQKAEAWLAQSHHPHLMVGALRSTRLYGANEAEICLDPQAQPYLKDHQIDGVPVLPGVMGTEAFAELANLLAAQAGSYRVCTVEREVFERPFKFYRMKPHILHLIARVAPVHRGELLAELELKSKTQPARTGLPVQEKVHFRATVRLQKTPLDSRPALDFVLKPASWKAISRDEIYARYFHGPSYQVLEQAQVGEDQAVGWMHTPLPPDSYPEKAGWLLSPRLIELCFQTVGIWELATKGCMALPAGLESVSFYPPDEQDQVLPGDKPLYALVEAIDGGKHFLAQVVDESGQIYVRLSGYRTIVVPV
ncbi:MAG: SDR family NAD(P)-dependent oxidoreductase [Omnitrophica WOR_2 bacterium]